MYLIHECVLRLLDQALKHINIVRALEPPLRADLGEHTSEQYNQCARIGLPVLGRAVAAEGASQFLDQFLVDGILLLQLGLKITRLLGGDEAILDVLLFALVARVHHAHG